ncbi:hypothetical protein [Glutamicibacter arilaitensis]|uniref:hypothetical protein n=1 Tax=Glutamicibacter arilaitensis TaxID=256701 RepID=UPI003F908A08
MSELNLPSAPEGHFWRVFQTMGLERIQLRKKVWFFSVKIGDIIPIMLHDATPAEAVEWGAHQILERLRVRQESEDFIKEHGGDHE